ncbi:MAG: D-alanyl-D-alanine carboxypeptidase [Alphaproteobacteria bacterium]|nr:D-alanyl-D-alanine carboxypeptidase [Alphaproteobacteria bacterium]
MNSKFIRLLFCLVTTFSVIGNASAAARSRSISSIVVDAATGKVISSSNADERRYPASLTKLMTLYIAFDALDKGALKPSDRLKISRFAANREPSKIGVRAGETISVDLAIKAIIVKSANDCATVLAEALGGTEDKFAQIMTQTARELGMKHTTFKNASGLPHKDQKTTARDMAILGSAIYHHFPEYYNLFSTSKFQYKGTTFYNHNHLLKQFKGTDGMKTGYTAAAGYNIVTSAQRGGKRVIAVTMGHNTIKERDRKVAQMMESGLNKIKGSTSTKMMAELKLPDINLDKHPSSTALASSAEGDNWAIQVGAFSNYSKARNYALAVQTQLKPAYASKTSVNVEPFSKGYSVVYRSQLTGLAKNEADKSCYQLQRDKKSCIVVPVNKKTQIAMVN